MDITYSVLNGAWQISGTITHSLVSDLQVYKLPSRGNYRESANLTALERSLTNRDKIKRFIAGLTDTIGSLAPSHRHRVDSAQIISFEFKGKNFALVSQVARLFTSIDCPPDQILWNHPNFHSANDRYYGSWKKGFKLRFALADYMLAGSFVSEAKKLSAKENMELNQERSEAIETIRINGRTTVHQEENSGWLPENIRGRHFVHYAHLAYYLGVPIDESALEFLQDKLQRPEALICPFTILTKGTLDEIERIIRNESYLTQTTYSTLDIPRGFLSAKLNDPECKNIFGKNNEKGFPLTRVINAVTFVALAESNSPALMGSRIRGDYIEAFRAIESDLAEIEVEVLRPDKGTCLLIRSQNFAALVGYTDDEFNRSLIEYDEDSLALKIKEPKFSDCVELS